MTIPDDNEFLNYVLSELVLHQEELEEKEMQKSNPRTLPYTIYKSFEDDLV